MSTRRNRNIVKRKVRTAGVPRLLYTKLSNGYTAGDSRSITFLDPHRYLTLKYVEIVTTTLAAVTAENTIFNLNSIFDPNRSLAGHQPYGYDQLAALYNRYRVLSTFWKVIFAAAVTSYRVAVIPSNGLLASAVVDQATFQTACEVPYGWNDSQPPAAPSIIRAQSMDLNKLGGVREAEFIADDRFEAQIGASPTEVVVLNICSFNPAGAGITPSFTVELHYMVDLHDPIILAGS